MEALKNIVWQTALGVLLAIPFAFFHAWVAKTIWWWYAVPAGLPTLSMRVAIGISLTVGVLRLKVPNKCVEDRWSIIILVNIVAPLFLLLVAKIVLVWL